MAQILNWLDGPVWREVRELYLQDRVEEAFEEAENIGALDTNDLYAEAEVRRLGTKWQVRPWLTVEGIESEIGHHIHSALEPMGTACEDLASRFGWDHREATMISLLPQDVEAPWMPGRWGYFIDKVPYDKICIPHHLLRDLDNLILTVKHEFMHDITTNVTNGKIPRWFGEGMSTLAEGRFDQTSLDDWRHSRAEWHNSIELDALVASDNRDAEKRREISRAYSQANFIARYLETLGGEPTLAALLRALGDETFLHNLQNQVHLWSRMEGGLRRVYGLSESEVFERAHAFVLAGGA
jgi:hypothetical protein